jgi:hypothetical protein
MVDIITLSISQMKELSHRRINDCPGVQKKRAELCCKPYSSLSVVIMWRFKIRHFP